jgi:DNA-binding MarR family transcriptional regulator
VRHGSSLDTGLTPEQAYPLDRRSFTVSLTADGDRAASRVRAAFVRLEKEALRAVPARSRDGFYEVLHGLDRITSGD